MRIAILPGFRALIPQAVALGNKGTKSVLFL
jgi:hypothetical protein